MSTEEDYAKSDQDFYIGKTHSSYFAAALYGEDGIIKATCRNFRLVLDEMNEDRTKKIESDIEAFEDELFFKGLEKKLRSERLEKEEGMDEAKFIGLNERIREELERRDEEIQADVLAIVGMASALSELL